MSCNTFVRYSHIFLLINYYCLVQILKINSINYKQFHYIFTIPFIAQFYIINKSLYYHNYANRKQINKNYFNYLLYGLILNIFITFIYTTPFDRFLIINKVWSYNEVYGTLFSIPYEEYLFFHTKYNSMFKF